MEIAKSFNSQDYLEFMAMVGKLRDKNIAFTFSGNVNANENDQDNFSVNWTSDEEV